MVSVMGERLADSERRRKRNQKNKTKRMILESANDIIP
jgi:hypothetical protein